MAKNTGKVREFCQSRKVGTLVQKPMRTKETTGFPGHVLENVGLVFSRLNFTMPSLLMQPI